MVKADGYGHGAVNAATAARRRRCNLARRLLDHRGGGAAPLRASTARILNTGWTMPGEMDAAARAATSTSPCSTPADVAAARRRARARGTPRCACTGRSTPGWAGWARGSRTSTSCATPSPDARGRRRGRGHLHPLRLGRRGVAGRHRWPSTSASSRSSSPARAARRRACSTAPTARRRCACGDAPRHRPAGHRPVRLPARPL